MAAIVPSTSVYIVHAGCDTCAPDGRALWNAVNALGLAAQHAQKRGHVTWAHVDNKVTFGVPKPAPAAAERGK